MGFHSQDSVAVAIPHTPPSFLPSGRDTPDSESLNWDLDFAIRWLCGIDWENNFFLLALVFSWSEG